MIVSVLVGTFAAAAAHAGSYTARFCAEGVSPSGDKGPFERSGNETVFALTNACGNANGLLVGHHDSEPATEGASGRWLATRPDGISVARIDYKARGTDQSGGYLAQVVGTTADGSLGIVNGGKKLDGSFKDYSVAGDLRRFGVQLVCQTGISSCAADPPTPPQAALKDVSYTLQDSSAPEISVTGGSLFEAPVQSGSQSISYEASDSGSGVYRALAIVNGAETGVTAADCRLGDGFALAFTPCPATAAGSIALDTAAPPWRNGRNEVSVCVEDYSSSSRVCGAGKEVLALNGCASNTVAAQTMSLGWPGHRGVVRSRQGRSRRATVRLFGPDRAPLAGAWVCFSRGVPTDKSGKERVLENAAITDAKGRASIRVRGQSSRFVRATYFAGPEAVITKRIRLNVSPAIRLGLRPKGDVAAGAKIRAVGVLRGRWKADRKVCFYVDGHKFDCDTSGRGGRARVGYRAKEPGKLRFYAKVSNQRDYPYTRGRSATKMKIVR